MLGDRVKLYSQVRKTRDQAANKISELRVGDKLYEGEHVPDGFYNSISQLKKLDHSALTVSPSFISATEEYRNILKLCTTGTKVPLMSKKTATDILKSIRPMVSNYYSITAAHYLNSGQAGIDHFHCLLNGIIEDLNSMRTIRSVNGNSPHLISRFVAYRKALYVILPVGLARRHRVNPVVGIQAHQVYGTPVLLSGITTLVLSTAEIRLLDQHVKNTVMNLQKLLDKTPRCSLFSLWSSPRICNSAHESYVYIWYDM